MEEENSVNSARERMGMETSGWLMLIPRGPKCLDCMSGTGVEIWAETEEIQTHPYSQESLQPTAKNCRSDIQVEYELLSRSVTYQEGTHEEGGGNTK